MGLANRDLRDFDQKNMHLTLVPSTSNGKHGAVYFVGFFLGGASYETSTMFFFNSHSSMEKMRSRTKGNLFK